MASYLYVCDGNVPSCGKTICKWLGRGPCSHTSDIGYARYSEPHVFVDVSGDGSELFERMRAEVEDEA